MPGVRGVRRKNHASKLRDVQYSWFYRLQPSPAGNFPPQLSSLPGKWRSRFWLLRRGAYSVGATPRTCRAHAGPNTSGNTRSVLCVQITPMSSMTARATPHLKPLVHGRVMTVVVVVVQLLLLLQQDLAFPIPCCFTRPRGVETVTPILKPQSCRRVAVWRCGTSRVDHVGAGRRRACWRHACATALLDMW